MLQTIRWMQTLHSGEEKHRVHKEDAIFGGMIGVLPYVAPSTQREILSVILPSAMITNIVSLKITKVQLWPSVKGKDGSRIIPDAMLHLETDSVNTLVVIEAKWDSHFSKGQAAKQYLYTKPIARSTSRRQMHLLLVRNRLLGRQHLMACKRRFPNIEMEVRTWGDILNALSIRLRETHDIGFRNWAKDAVEALQLLGEKPFEGFNHLSRPWSMLPTNKSEEGGIFYLTKFEFYPPSKKSRNPVFWRG